ncbi:MAG: hypothetical protein ACRCZ2_13835 [Fusobacteriaceae bacterium]
MRIFDTIGELRTYVRANNTKAFFSYEEVEPTHVVYDIYDIYNVHGDGCKMIEKVGVRHIEITRGVARKILKLKRVASPEAIEKIYEKNNETGKLEFVWEDYVGEGIWNLTKKDVSKVINGHLNIVGARFFFSDTTITVLDSEGEMAIYIDLNGLNF